MPMESKFVQCEKIHNGNYIIFIRVANLQPFDIVELFLYGKPANLELQHGLF